MVTKICVSTLLGYVKCWLIFSFLVLYTCEAKIKLISISVHIYVCLPVRNARVRFCLIFMEKWEYQIRYTTQYYILKQNTSWKTMLMLVPSHERGQKCDNAFINLLTSQFRKNKFITTYSSTKMHFFMITKAMRDFGN